MTIRQSHSTYAFPRWRSKRIGQKAAHSHHARDAEHAPAEPRCCSQLTGEYAGVYRSSGDADHVYLYMGNEP